MDLFIHVAQAATEAAAETHNTGLAGVFGLDWKLFIAQLVNFSIIFFVLWKWVFTPVANALTQRQERIERSLKDASGIDAQKTEFEKWQRDEMAKARTEASKIVADAEGQAEKAKAEIMNSARQEQERIIATGKTQLEQEKDKLVQSAKLELAGLVVTAVEKILDEKLDAKKDTEIIKAALKDTLR